MRVCVFNRVTFVTSLNRTTEVSVWGDVRYPRVIYETLLNFLSLVLFP